MTRVHQAPHLVRAATVRHVGIPERLLERVTDLAAVRLDPVQPGGHWSCTGCGEGLLRGEVGRTRGEAAGGRRGEWLEVCEHSVGVCDCLLSDELLSMAVTSAYISIVFDALGTLRTK